MPSADLEGCLFLSSGEDAANSATAAIMKAMQTVFIMNINILNPSQRICIQAVLASVNRSRCNSGRAKIVGEGGYLQASLLRPLFSPKSLKTSNINNSSVVTCCSRSAYQKLTLSPNS